MRKSSLLRTCNDNDDDYDEGYGIVPRVWFFEEEYTNNK